MLQSFAKAGSCITRYSPSSRELAGSELIILFFKPPSSFSLYKCSYCSPAQSVVECWFCADLQFKLHTRIVDSNLKLGSTLYFSHGSTTTTEESGVISSHSQYGTSYYPSTNSSIVVTGLNSAYGFNKKLLLVYFNTSIATFSVYGGSSQGACEHYLSINGNQMCSRYGHEPRYNNWNNYILESDQDSVMFHFSATYDTSVWRTGFLFTYIGRWKSVFLHTDSMISN